MNDYFDVYLTIYLYDIKFISLKCFIYMLLCVFELVDLQIPRSSGVAEGLNPG